MDQHELVKMFRFFFKYLFQDSQYLLIHEFREFNTYAGIADCQPFLSVIRYTYQFMAWIITFMDINQNPIFSGISLGRWFETNVRVSLFLVLLPLVFCFRLGLQLGLIVSLILFLSILFHEFCHVFAARGTGGEGEDILMWPLGGLAFVTPANSLFSQFWTVAAGPISNLVLCLLMLPVVLSTQTFVECVNLTYLPGVDLVQSSMLRDLALLTFSLNFKLLILNLLPVYPLDGHGMTLSIAREYWDKQTATIGTLWTGLVVCMLLLVAGLALESVNIVFIGSLLMIFSMHEFTKVQIARQFGDMYGSEGYGEDYSSSYDDDEPKLGPIARWKLRREEKKREKLQIQKMETAQKVDQLLEKINNNGIASLTEAERRFLEQASSKYRTK